MVSHPPIPISELASHIERLKANDNLKFSQEYESIEPGQQFTWDHSNMEVNKPKNRYANVIAYDHSRVILPSEGGILGKDYINANYCDGYRKHNAYVATQGPLPETFADFWRMCWELKSATIVMMTKLEERTRIKCDQYWPTRGAETYLPAAYTHIQKLMQLEPGESISGMEHEFKKLGNIKTDSSRFATANLPCNKQKNRLVHILPFESTRVCLTPLRNVEGSDYINASFIDGYRYRKAYIATQGPMSDTTEDFWRMLWEHNSTIIVMLTKLKEMGRA
ncbi:hypothetical protein NQ318_008163 [Aromia moschata]|uniref:Tyrosine-protein phosphatase domain-containing protein n=1 Tax=Aromia moschata TaxID=1265417 RepID=A0AAV8YKZ7_9CUCU|nr:hypothetical protein NQ318_008163 [Aromia moschata]